MRTALALLAVALVALGLSARMAANSRDLAEPPALRTPPPEKPPTPIIAGSGVVEPITEEIRIGTPVGGLVAEVFVKEGDEVAAGTPLFRLDDRELAAELRTREAEVAEAEAALARLRALPRRESLRIAEAARSEALANLELATLREERLAQLQDARAASREAYEEAQAGLKQAAAQVEAAEADLALLRQGTWAEDLRVAEANLGVLRTRAAETNVNLGRLTVTAPIDCVVLNLNVRPGEYVPNASDTSPLMIVGQARPLAVRVDIDETDLWRFDEAANATIFMRGNPQISANATLLDIEPRVVPKVSLTGARNERVDIRVFQARYRVEGDGGNFRIGQQVDVHILTGSS
ncbi:MAG: HlyD family efflux transporter periplasmic adaptor subunit [Candidatus Sumerlaeia bacterium]|nr:HlyD family efflux transporter periplasmic adaptor subunit [Candidatus Sumerlaeia bacterium]